MSRIDVAAVKRDHPIADVVAASGVELHPHGRSYMASCPFHGEDRHPSMSVDGIEGRFHCFACGAGGDVIDYVSRLEGIDFLQAVERLSHSVVPATGLGPPSPRVEPKSDPVPSRTLREEIFELNEHAWRYFTEPSHRYQAERYLHGERGIDINRVRTLIGGEYPAGYAPDRWRRLSSQLRHLGATAEQITDAGLARPHGERLIDTYRGRVVVPTRDRHGHIEGFLGRDLTGHPTAPKYLNPPTTAAFDKSRSLYWPLGRPSQQGRNVVIVEGFIDALAVAANRSALNEPVFPCSAGGIAVSLHQAREVAMLTIRPVLLALDADPAGRAGAQRWRHRLGELNRTTHMSWLPSGQDPADLAKRLSVATTVRSPEISRGPAI